MNHPGEIDRLCEIAMPHIGVITNIGPSHLEFLDSLKKVFEAKSELLRRLPKKGVAILNEDDPYLRNIKWLKCKRLYFGIEKKCDFRARDLRYAKGRWGFSIKKGHKFVFPLLGRHNVYNALIAIAVGRQFGIDFSVIKKRLRLYNEGPPMRLELKKVHGFEILDDSYNSNPVSMEGAIDTLARYNTRGKRIVVSGDMAELGRHAERMHGTIGRKIGASSVDILVTLGRLSRFTDKGAKEKGMKNIYHAESHNDAAGFLRRFARAGDVILIKGSRAMQMERVIENLKGA